MQQVVLGKGPFPLSALSPQIPYGMPRKDHGTLMWKVRHWTAWGTVQCHSFVWQIASLSIQTVSCSSQQRSARRNFNLMWVGVHEFYFDLLRLIILLPYYLNIRKKPINCYILSTALYGAKTWTLWNVDQKYLESFEIWSHRRMQKTSWNDPVRSEL